MQSECEWARAVVRDAARRYLANRRDQVDDFVKRHFGLAGTLRLHRRTMGWDLLRVPANLLLAPAALAFPILSRIAAHAGLARWAAWLRRHRLVFDTATAREVSWLVTTELLQFPCEQSGRSSSYDALAEMILADPRVASRIGRDVLSTQLREQIGETMAAYVGARSATAEIATGCFAASFGALSVKQVTPGMMTLGSVVAGMLAQQSAIATFPLGAWLGAWWYGMYPATPNADLLIIIIGALTAFGALLAVLSGIVTDPLQRVLGLHRKRLLRLIDTLERGLCDDGAANFPLRDHYVARVLDLLDLAQSVAYRLAVRSAAQGRTDRECSAGKQAYTAVSRHHRAQGRRFRRGELRRSPGTAPAARQAPARPRMTKLMNRLGHMLAPRSIPWRIRRRERSSGIALESLCSSS